MVQSRQRTQAVGLGSLVGFRSRSHCFSQIPQAVQESVSRRRKKTETRLNRPRIAPRGQRSRHQGRWMKKMVIRNAARIVSFMGFGQVIGSLAVAWVITLGRAASRAPAGQMLQMKRG